MLAQCTCSTSTDWVAIGTAFATAFAGLVALAAAVIAWSALQDQKQARASGRRRDLFDRLLTNLALDTIPKFVRESNALFAKHRRESVAGGAKQTSDMLENRQRLLTSEFLRIYHGLSEPLLNGAAIWSDHAFYDVLEARLEKVEDLVEDFPRLLDPRSADPHLQGKLAERIVAVGRMLMIYDASVPYQPLRVILKEKFFGGH